MEELRDETDQEAGAFDSPFLGILFFPAVYCFGGELIARTRMLGEPGKAWGSLTVFSEPPQLEAYLDGEKIGLTPLWLKDLETGLHTIKIANAQTRVHVEEGQRVKIGLFKGSFVTSREPKKVTPEFESQIQEPSMPPSVQPQEEEGRKNDLNSWEKFVNGTQKFF